MLGLHFDKFCNIRSTVGCATTNDATMNECYNEQFLSIKSGCYIEQRCCNECGEILLIIGSSIIVLAREILITLFMCDKFFMTFIRESLFTVWLCFSNLHLQCVTVKKKKKTPWP